MVKPPFSYGIFDVQITSGHQRLDGRDRRRQGVDVSVRARTTAGGVATELQRGGTWHGERRVMVDFHGDFASGDVKIAENGPVIDGLPGFTYEKW